MPPFLSLIIPAHNEELRLPQTLREVIAFAHAQPYPTEIVVVDSGSQDQTAMVAQTSAQRYAGLRVLRIPRPGKGLAVRTGMLAASGEYRFICDADLSMPIAEVNCFLPPRLEDFDIAIGSREIQGAIRYGEPVYRHWIGRVFNWLVRLLAVPGFQDTQCGFKCFRGTVAQELFALQLLDGWTFDVEVLFLALRKGHRIVEVGIPWYYNPGSKVRLFWDSVAMLADLFRIRRNWKRGLYGAESGRAAEARSEP